MLLEQQQRIFKILNYQNYKSKYFTNRQWISLLHKLQTIEPSKQNISRITSLVDIIGISLFDHLESFIPRLHNVSKDLIPLLQEFIVTCLSKFYAIEQIQVFEELNKLSIKIVKERKEYLETSQQSSQNNVDRIWLKYFKLQGDAFVFLDEVQSLNLNYLEYLLLKKIYLHYLHSQVQQFNQNQLIKITNQIPLCCKTSFTFRENLLDQTFYDETYIQYRNQLDLFQNNDLRETICAFLNTNGGIILYGIECHSLYKRVIGKEVNSDEMQKSKNLMRLLMEQFYPDTITKKLYRFDFVPVKNIQGDYRKGLFVLRIKILNGEKTHLYHHKASQKIFIREGNQNKLLQVEEIYDMIRYKVLLEQNQQLIIHDGDCDQPQNGIQLYSVKNSNSNRFQNNNYKNYNTQSNYANYNNSNNSNNNYASNSNYSNNTNHFNNNNYKSNHNNNTYANTTSHKQYKQSPKYILKKQKYTLKSSLTVIVDTDKYFLVQRKFRESKIDVQIILSDNQDIIGIWHNEKPDVITKLLESQIYNSQKKQYIHIKQPDVLIIQNSEWNNKQFVKIILNLLRQRNINCECKKNQLLFDKYHDTFTAFCFLYNTEILVKFQSI